MSDKLNEIIITEIRPMQLGRAAAEGHAEVLTDLVKSGDVKPLDMATRLKFIMSVCEQTISQIQDECIREAESYGKGEKIVVNNAVISVSETGVKYDYARTGDSRWKDCSEREKMYAESRKEREKFLKALTDRVTIVEPYSLKEEVITPPRKTASLSVKISFQE